MLSLKTHLDPLLHSFFCELSQKKTQKLTCTSPSFNILLNDLSHLLKLSWSLVDHPLLSSQNQYSDLKDFCNYLSHKYSCFIMPQTSHNNKYLRGIILDAKTFEMASLENLKWINPPKGMYYKIIKSFKFILICTKRLDSYCYNNNYINKYFSNMNFN